MLERHGEPAARDGADRTLPGRERAVRDVVRVGDELGDVELLAAVVEEEQHARVQIESVLQHLEEVKQRLMHLLHAGTQEALLIVRPARRRRRDEPEHPGVVANLLALLVELALRALAYARDLDAREDQIQEPEEHDEGRVHREWLDVHAVLAHEPEKALERHRDDDEERPDRLLRKRRDERDQDVDERIERAFEPTPELHGGVHRSEEEQSELEVERRPNAYAARLRLEPHDRARGEHGHPRGPHERVLEPELVRSDSEDGQEVENEERRGRDVPEGSASGAPNGERRMDEGGHADPRSVVLGPRRLRKKGATRRSAGPSVDIAAREPGSPRATPRPAPRRARAPPNRCRPRGARAEEATRRPSPPGR